MGDPRLSSSTIWKAVALGAGVSVTVGLLGYAVLGRRPRPPEFNTSWQSPAGKLTYVLYSSDGKYLAAGSASGQVLLWTLPDRKPRRLTELTKKPIIALTLSADGFLAASDTNGEFFGWQLETSQTRLLPKLPAPVACIAFQPSRFESPGIILGLTDGRLMAVDDLGTTMVESGHKGGVKRAAYSPKGDLLVTGGTDGTLVWRNSATRTVIATVAAHTSEVSALVFCTDGRQLASADWNGEIRVWSVADRKQTASFRQPDAVSAMGWIKESLVTGSWDGCLRFWSLQQTAPAQTVDTGDVIHDLAVSPSGETVATVSNRDCVELWRAPTQ